MATIRYQKLVRRQKSTKWYWNDQAGTRIFCKIWELHLTLYVRWASIKAGVEAEVR